MFKYQVEKKRKLQVLLSMEDKEVHVNWSGIKYFLLTSFCVLAAQKVY